MARKAMSTLNIPMDHDLTYDDNDNTASKIKIILSSDHTLRKSSLKAKGVEEESKGAEKDFREISKSVKWREGNGLEDVMLIEPRSNIMDLITSNFSLPEASALLRESSSIDLTTFKSLKPDFDLKEFSALGHTHVGPFASKDDSASSPDDFMSDDDTNEKTIAIQAFGDIKSSNQQTDEKIIKSVLKTQKHHSDSPDSDDTIVQESKISARKATEIIPKGPLANLIKTLRKPPGKVSVGTPSIASSDSRAQGKRNKGSKSWEFTKPTIRYSVPPFDYETNSSFLEVQESFCSIDSEFLNSSSKFGKGKFYVLYTEDTDYNFLCLDELFKEVYRSFRFGTRMPSERTTAAMIDDLQTDFKPAVVDAPPGFNPGKESDWMDLGIKLSMVKYSKPKEMSSVFPLTDLNFKELIITGDRIGPLENYMLVGENYLTEMKPSLLDDMIPSPGLDINQNEPIIPKMNEPASQLKVLTGNPYRFPKLVIPSHTPHPEVARLRQTNLHVVMDKKPESPPPSPLPELKPLIKIPLTVETLYTKPNMQILPHHESKTSVPKARRHMLAKSRAKTNFSMSPDTTASECTDDKTSPITLQKRESVDPKKLRTILKYRPRSNDYSTFVKSTHWNPIPQIVTKQTKMSLFKQILTEEDVIANTNALQGNSSHHSRSRPMITVPSTLYGDLQEHNNTIVLTRDDVLELIGGQPEIPKYYKNTLLPGIYVPCARNRNSDPPHNKEIPKCKHRTPFALPQLKELPRQIASRIVNSLNRRY